MSEEEWRSVEDSLSCKDCLKATTLSMKWVDCSGAKVKGGTALMASPPFFFCGALGIREDEWYQYKCARLENI